MQRTWGRQCGAVSLGLSGPMKNNPTFLFQPLEVTRLGHRKIAVPIVEKNPNERGVEIRGDNQIETVIAIHVPCRYSKAAERPPDTNSRLRALSQFHTDEIVACFRPLANQFHKGQIRLAVTIQVGKHKGRIRSVSKRSSVAWSM